MADIASRLEAVVSRLEAYASNLGASSSGGVRSSGAAVEERRKSPKLLDYEDFVAKSLPPFIESTKKFKPLEKIGEQAQTVFDRFHDLIDAESVSKKPSNDELIKFLDPVVQVIQSADKAAGDNRSEYFNQNKAWAEATQAFAWPTVGGPRQHVTDTLESADFYLNKVLTGAKKEGGAKEKDLASFALTLKSLLKDLAEFVGTTYRAGLEWNAKGSPLSSFTSSSSSSSAAPPAAPGGAPPPPPGPPPDLSSLPPPPSSSFAPSASTSKPSGEAGMGAVFDAIRASNTSGLKKVTDDMKTHKNPQLRAANTVPDSKPTPTATKSTSSASTAAKPVGEPKTELRKGTWFVENHTSGVVNVEGVELKENVYITKCSNCTVKIPGKIKSIAVDGCKRVEIEFEQVVSIFEMVNSQNCKIECSNLVPAVQIDKSSGISIILLSRDAVAAVPGIVTSNTSELNLVVPGKTDEDDPIEIPLPEQYVTKYQNGKLVTVPSDI